VALHYFKSFFLPTELTADSDWGYVQGAFSTEAVAGYFFVVALLYAAYRTSRDRRTRPIAFGLVWFLLALLPTSLTPLAEVTNDHRMFFPFVGLALAVWWTVRMLLMRRRARRTLVRGAAVAAVLALIAEAAGTRQRNEVWSSDESLWGDVAMKSPRNGRGLMHYGLALMNRGDYAGALSYFESALQYTPNYSTLEVNLGIANGGLHRDAEAERHFRRAVELAPAASDSHFYYGRWLNQSGRKAEAAAELEAAVSHGAYEVDPRDLLMQVYSDQGNASALAKLALDTLRIAPSDERARRFLAEGPRPAADTPESLLDRSLHEYQAGRYAECIAAAMRALQLRPDYAEAYNNIAAGYIKLERWDEAIRAAHEALRIKPDYQLAKNNLAWAESRGQGSAAR
jgi:tetratricopeptide (TPR) repeat protein